MPVTCGKVQRCLMFPPFTDHDSYWTSLESQSFRNDFLHFSNSKIFELEKRTVSDVFLDFFVSEHIVLIFKIFVPTS